MEGTWAPAFAGETGGLTGRRSRAARHHAPSPPTQPRTPHLPVIPAKAGNHVPPNPAQPRTPRPSFRRKPETTYPPTQPNHAPPARHSGESRKPRTPNPQGQPVNARRRSTTETAEAWKGRGPRLSPGRREGRRGDGVGPPVITYPRRQPNPAPRTPPSFRRKPETTYPRRQPNHAPRTSPSFRRKPETTYPQPPRTTR